MRTRATALVVLMLAATAAAAQTPDVTAAGKPKQGPQTRWRFPVKGEHDYGNPDNNGFGVKRPDGSRHTGQDVIADYGQPLVATHRAKVEARGDAKGIGHHVVLDGIGTKLSFSYAHMKGPGGPARATRSRSAAASATWAAPRSAPALPPSLRALEGALALRRPPHQPDPLPAPLGQLHEGRRG